MKTHFILITALIISCSKNSYQPSQKQNSINHVRKKAAYSIQKKYGLIPCGTGGQAMDQIQMLALMFDYRQPIDMERGRELLIKSVEEFANEINTDPTIRPYLVQYPFKPENIEIRIYIHDRQGNHFAEDQLCVISSLTGTLNYIVPDDKPPGLKIICQETYSEALKRLEDTRSQREKEAG